MEAIRLGARLRAARKAAGFKTAKEFLKKHKVPGSTYSQHESGARSLNDESLKFYSKVFGVSFNWLKAGEGQPFSHITTAKKNALAEELIDLKPLKKITRHLNQELLSAILSEILQTYELNLSASAVKKISKEVAHIYADITSANTSFETQKKMLKPAISTYKRLAKKLK